jgi:hypothetical protein
MSFDLEKLTKQMNRIKHIQETIDISEEKTPSSKKNPLEGTYLESKESIEELYKLFIFYGLLEAYFHDYNL